MKRILCLGDTHHRDTWKDILNKEDITTLDRIVFIGDYFDSWDIDYHTGIVNFRDIIALKNLYPEKVVLLIGNHDHSYLYYERCSGFNPAFAPTIHDELREAYNNNLIKIAHEEDGILFTHAGLCNKFRDANAGYLEMHVNVSEGLMALYEDNPSAFDNQGIDPSGDTQWDSPIWTRPRSLNMHGEYDGRQVVGHTHLRSGVTNIDDKYFFIDAIASKEYLVFEDGVPIACKLIENDNISSKEEALGGNKEV